MARASCSRTRRAPGRWPRSSAVSPSSPKASDEAVVLVLGGDMPMLRPGDPGGARRLQRGEQQASPPWRPRTASCSSSAPPGRWARLRDGAGRDRAPRRRLGGSQPAPAVRAAGRGRAGDAPDHGRGGSGHRHPGRPGAGAVARPDPASPWPRSRPPRRWRPPSRPCAVRRGRGRRGGAHLVLLPEATLTPFGTDLRAAALAHHEDFAQLVQELAEEHGVVVVAGSFTPTEDGRVHNTVIVRGPNWDPHLRLPQDPSLRRLRCGRIAHRRARRRAAHLRSGRHSARDRDLLRRAIPGTVHALAQRGAQADPAPAGLEGRARQARTAPAAAAGPRPGLHAPSSSPPTSAAAGDYTGGAARGIGRSAVVGPLGRVRQELGRDPGMLLVDLDLDEVEAARTALPVLRHHVELTRL